MSDLKKCPFCAEEIKEEALKCKHCGSMLDGSSIDHKVTVSGIDPFAQYHTEIKGKKKGKITFVGYLGFGLGLLMLFVSCSMINNLADGGESGSMIGLMGIGTIIACYLWARR